MAEHSFDIMEFDREFSLQELFNAIDTSKLENVLNTMLEGNYHIVTPKGITCLGHPTTQIQQRLPFSLELEPIGYMETSSNNNKTIEAAHTLVLMQLQSAQRYLMASSLHIQAIQEDYQELAHKHHALTESEARYKELCEQLDDKVKAQLKTIESTQRKLFASEKMASVGQLAAGIAHEINNPIGFINSNLNSAKNYINEIKQFSHHLSTLQTIEQAHALWRSSDLDFVLEDFGSLVDESVDGAERIAHIVSDLKVFANIDSEEEMEVDINRYISVSCNVAQTNLDDTINLQFVAEELPHCKCKPAYLGQVVLGLIMNAKDAVQKNRDQTTKQITINSFANDNRIVVTVSDNGMGIPQPIIDQVFDPFFTTKEVGQGKGLGLTYCQDIIKAHGGEISLQSNVNEGTTVTFWIPIKQ